MKRRDNDSGKMMSLQNLQTQLRDVKLRIALLEAARQENETAAAHFDTLPPDAPERLEEQAFRVRTEEKTLSLIRREERKSQRAQRFQGIHTVMRFVAAVLLISFLGLGTAMAFSPALRVTVMRLLYRVTPQYTEISLVQDEGASFDVPADWSGNYFPAYIPPEYTFYSVSGTKSIRAAIYVGEGDHILRFYENDEGVEGNIDTENYELSNIEIRGLPVLLATKAGKSRVVWSEGNRLFVIMITEDADTAIRIAQSVTIIK